MVPAPIAIGPAETRVVGAVKATVLGLAEVQGKHVGGGGIALAWEIQLLPPAPK